MVIRAFFVLALVGFAAGARPSAAESGHLRAVRAEIAATHPGARLRAEIGRGLRRLVTRAAG